MDPYGTLLYRQAGTSGQLPKLVPSSLVEGLYRKGKLEGGYKAHPEVANSFS